jgi:dienelactone hydrolase
MDNLDVILLVGLITLASWLIIIPKRISRILKPLVVLTILLFFIQYLIEGYYWQYIPAYFLLLVVVIRTLLENRLSSNFQKRLFQVVLVLLIITSIIPWTIFLPIPKLLEPQGDYRVGTRIFRWVDLDRAEEITSDTEDKRNVIVQAWYPTTENANTSHSYYLDGLGNLPGKVGIIPRGIFDHYDQVNTHGILNAPISKTQKQWPVVIFLTGNVASRAFYTSLVSGLASHGYVVLAIDHPYEAIIAELADGTIATTIENYQNDEPDLLNFMKRRLDLRVADVQFVLNQLDNIKSSSDGFFSALDKNRIVITGHSLGGASAAVAMAVDSRIKAAANIDGTLYGGLPEPSEERHFLLIESKKDSSSRLLRYENGNQKLFKHFGGGYRYEIPQADHYSFTDAPLLLAFPTRFLAGHFLEFGNIPAKTNTATVEILNAFFMGALNSNLKNLDSVASRYKDVIQKPIDVLTLPRD